MAVVGPVAAKLREFVCERVRKDGAHYARGNASRLAEHLGVAPSWVTEYTDHPPRNHADLDTAVAICDFYGINLGDFAKGRPMARVLPKAESSPLVRGLVEALATKKVPPTQALAAVNVLRLSAGLPVIAQTPARRRGRRA
jgi:hypothetical protein